MANGISHRLMPTMKSCREPRLKIIRQLRNLQVFTAREVIQEWEIYFKRKWVKGPPGNGIVAFSAKEDTVNIYLCIKSVLDGDTPIELVDGMFDFCRMQGCYPSHSEMCLYVALSQNDPLKISKVFADKGIPSLESLWFANDEEETKETRHDYDDDDGLPRYSDHNNSGSGSKSKPRLELLLDKSNEPSRLRKVLPALKITGLVILAPLLRISERRQRREVFDDNGDYSGATPGSADQKPMPPIPGPTSTSGCNNSFLRSLERFTTTNEDVAFRGEFALHKLLSETLGDAYSAARHWTSPQRHLHNTHLPRLDCAAASPDAASHFRFEDPDGAFTALLVNESYLAAREWLARPPTYHIDVRATRRGLHTEFDLGDRELGKAKRYTVMRKGPEDETPRDVYLIARVYELDIFAAMKVDTKGKGRRGERQGDEAYKVAFLVDPWACWHNGTLDISIKNGSRASIGRSYVGEADADLSHGA